MTGRRAQGESGWRRVMDSDGLCAGPAVPVAIASQISAGDDITASSGVRLTVTLPGDDDCSAVIAGRAALGHKSGKVGRGWRHIAETLHGYVCRAGNAWERRVLYEDHVIARAFIIKDF